MKVKSESEVAQSCSTLSDPMDCSLPGSSIHGIFQAKVLEWGAIAFSNDYSGFISFRIDWFHLLAVQGTLESLLQHHNSKTSVLQHATFFMVQLSHLHMTTGKTIDLTRWGTFVSKVMSLLCNMLSRLVITSLPRSKGLNFMAAVTICSDFGAPEIKSATVYTISPSICQEVMRPGAMIFVF